MKWCRNQTQIRDKLNPLGCHWLKKLFFPSIQHNVSIQQNKRSLNQINQTSVNQQSRWLIGILATTGVWVLTACNEPTLITPPVSLGNGLNTPKTEQFPRFSYDGRYLVFASDRNGQREIALYDRINGQMVSLPGLNRPKTWQDQPDISADGRYIVYLSEQSGKSDIWLYDRQTLESQNLTENWLGESRHPTISGNGRFIAFENNRSGQWDIMLYDRGLGIDLALPQPSSAPAEPK